MNTLAAAPLAVLAGAALAAQSASNARLGTLLHNPIAACSAAFAVSLVVSTFTLLTVWRPLPSAEQATSVPLWLWGTGGTLSVIGVATFYWLIPRVGVAHVVTFAIVGQLFFASLAGHYGWFGVPTERFGITKLVGIALLLAGATLVQRPSFAAPRARNTSRSAADIEYKAHGAHRDEPDSNRALGRR